MTDAMGNGRMSDAEAARVVASIKAGIKKAPFTVRNAVIMQLPVKLRSKGTAGNGYATQSLLPMDWSVANARVGKKSSVIIGLRPIVPANQPPMSWTQAEVTLDKFDTYFGPQAGRKLMDIAFADVEPPAPIIPTAESLLIADEMGQNYGSW